MWQSTPGYCIAKSLVSQEIGYFTIGITFNQEEVYLSVIKNFKGNRANMNFKINWGFFS